MSCPEASMRRQRSAYPRACSGLRRTAATHTFSWGPSGARPPSGPGAAAGVPAPGAAGRPGPRSGDQAGVVADLAHQLLEHVLEGDDADHGAVRVGGGAEVGAGGLHALERLPQRLLGADPGKLADPGAGDRLVPSV